MSRYYDIQIFSPQSQELVKRWTSHPDGLPSSTWPDPGAQDVEIDLPVTGYANPSGNAFVRVWGISLAEIGQSQSWNPNPSGKFGSGAITQGSNTAGGPVQPVPPNAKLIGASIAIRGGMGKGLPLANPAQAGLLVSGTINEAFGNWQGTDMTLDMYVVGGNITGNQLANLSVEWPANTPLSDLIKKTLNLAFPGYAVDINIDQSLVLPNAETGFYGSLTSFAQYLRGISKHIKGKDATYQGVQLFFGPNKNFIVTDGTTQKSPKTIEFIDLIGQPTWLNTAKIGFTCVMRSDILVDDYVELPNTMQTSTQGSVLGTRDQLAFQGTFQVYSVRHIGRFRNPNGASWITVFEATAQKAA